MTKTEIGGAQVLTLTPADVARLRAAIAERLAPSDAAAATGVIDSYLRVLALVRAQGTTIARLRKLFGLRTSERTKDVLADATANGDDEQTTDASSSSKTAADDANDGGNAQPAANDVAKATTPQAKPNGHGRIAAARYGDAQHIAVAHAALHAGDPCPRCAKGTLYALAPEQILRIVGQAPLVAVSWDCERCRCSACGDVIKATPPPEAQGPKYSDRAVAMMAVLRYGAGVPLLRLQVLQENVGTPVPASTQWEAVSARVDLFAVVHAALLHCAAASPLLHSDDTPMRILEWMGKRRAKLLAANELADPERTGIYTTGVVAETGDGHRIAAFFTGRHHAGENVDDLLAAREKGSEPPLLMSDALNRNDPAGHEVVVANCLAHARRNFVEQAGSFLPECRFVLEKLGEIYGIDDLCRAHGLSDAQRLVVHQRASTPIVDELQSWMTKQIEENLVEPNSDLGHAYLYMLRRWERFTRFLHIAGAPLDNTLCERALKKAILHRKGSLFYRTQKGAHVGDVLMTLIHTAELHGANPFDYLLALLENEDLVRAAPEDWLPWRYVHTRAALAGERARPAA